MFVALCFNWKALCASSQNKLTLSVCLAICRWVGDAVRGQSSTGQHPGQESQEEGQRETAGGSQVRSTHFFYSQKLYGNFSILMFLVVTSCDVEAYET